MATKDKDKMVAAEYLKRPYGRLLLPEEDGTFAAEIFEFPGCVAVGDTATEALANLEEVAIDWINATIAQGQDIPEPMESSDYSGKLVLRMSKGLHKRAAQCADREGISLNSFIVGCLHECVGTRARRSPAFAQPAQTVASVYLQIGFAPLGRSDQGLFPDKGLQLAMASSNVFGLPILREKEESHA